MLNLVCIVSETVAGYASIPIRIHCKSEVDDWAVRLLNQCTSGTGCRVLTCQRGFFTSFYIYTATANFSEPYVHIIIFFI